MIELLKDLPAPTAAPSPAENHPWRKKFHQFHGKWPDLAMLDIGDVFIHPSPSLGVVQETVVYCWKHYRRVYRIKRDGLV